MRTTVLIVASLLVAGCAAPGTDHRATIMPRDAEERAKLEAFRAASKEEQQRIIEASKIKNREKRDQWLARPDTAPYLKWLCTLPPGAERAEALDRAFKDYGVYEPGDVTDDAQAEEIGMYRLTCDAS